MRASCLFYTNLRSSDSSHGNVVQDIAFRKCLVRCELSNLKRVGVELRRSPRINVTWRGAFKASDGTILPIKVINISDSGILFQCPQPAPINKDHQMMLEIPHIDHIREMYKVPCKVHVLHCILSGDFFRIGVKFVEISELHRDLLAAWVSLTSKLDP